MSAPAAVVPAHPTEEHLDSLDADGLRDYLAGPSGWDVAVLGQIQKPCVSGGTSATSVRKLLHQAKAVRAKVLGLPPPVNPSANQDETGLPSGTIPSFPSEEAIGELAKDNVVTWTLVLKYLQAGGAAAPASVTVLKYPQAGVTSDALSAIAARLTFFDPRGLPEFSPEDDILREQLIELIDRRYVARSHVDNPAAAAALRTVQAYMGQGSGAQPSAQILASLAHLAGDVDGRRLLGESGVENSQILTSMHQAGQMQAEQMRKGVLHKSRAQEINKAFSDGDGSSGRLPLVPPIEADYVTHIKNFRAARMTTLDGICAGTGSFDDLCRSLVFQAYISHVDNDVLFIPLLGHSRVLALFSNKYGPSLNDGSGLTFTTSFPTGGLASSQLRFSCKDLETSLKVIDAVRACVSKSSPAPRFTVLLGVVDGLASDWYQTYSGHAKLPGIQSQEHFVFVLFHWLFARWGQRAQAAYSVDMSNIPTFVAQLSSLETLHPLVKDALALFSIVPSNKRPRPDGSGEPPNQNPQGKQTKKEMPSLKDYLHMRDKGQPKWKTSCIKFNSGLACYCQPGKVARPHICCICGERGVAAYNHCDTCSQTFLTGVGKSGNFGTSPPAKILP
jgi:hypothetical protein